NSVKKLIKSSSFFINVDKLVQVLKPVKTAIILLESASVNLADCFLQLILLANAIKKLSIQGMQEFRQHSINAFNKYCEKFDPNIYILAYFLHPAFSYVLKKKYWKIIITIAAQIWKNKGDELHKMIEDSTFLQFEEEEEKEEENNNIALEIPTHDVHVLIIEQLFDLKDIDTANNENNDNSSNSENDNSDNNSYSDSNSSDDNNDYDIELLTEKYLLNNDREIL
ncbi:841_t:CDS:2, partial [Funneliformis geosporum]